MKAYPYVTLGGGVVAGYAAQAFVAQQAERVIYRGDVAGGSFSVWWLSPAGRLLAAFVMNQPEEERLLAQQWVEAGQLLKADCLSTTASLLDCLGD